IARAGAVFSCPNGIPETIHAERSAALAYLERNGRPHPALVERPCALPTEQEVREMLGSLECSFAVFDNVPVDVWLTMRVLAETLSEQGASAESHRVITERARECL